MCTLCSRTAKGFSHNYVRDMLMRSCMVDQISFLKLYSKNFSLWYKSYVSYLNNVQDPWIDIYYPKPSNDIHVTT